MCRGPPNAEATGTYGVKAFMFVVTVGQRHGYNVCNFKTVVERNDVRGSLVQRWVGGVSSDTACMTVAL